MFGFFRFAELYNQDVSHFDVSRNEDFGQFFAGAAAFNQPLPWNTSSGINFDFMFNEALLFNQDISSWNISSACSMTQSFVGADSFNQDLNAWGLQVANSACNVSTEGLFASSGCKIDDDPVPGKYFCQCSKDANRGDCPRSSALAFVIVGGHSLLSLVALSAFLVT